MGFLALCPHRCEWSSIFAVCVWIDGLGMEIYFILTHSLLGANLDLIVSYKILMESYTENPMKRPRLPPTDATIALKSYKYTSLYTVTTLSAWNRNILVKFSVVFQIKLLVPTWYFVIRHGFWHSS